jgi:hypothetical protein
MYTPPAKQSPLPLPVTAHIVVVASWWRGRYHHRHIGCTLALQYISQTISAQAPTSHPTSHPSHLSPPITASAHTHSRVPLTCHHNSRHIHPDPSQERKTASYGAHEQVSPRRKVHSVLGGIRGGHTAQRPPRSTPPRPAAGRRTSRRGARPHQLSSFGAPPPPPPPIRRMYSSWYFCECASRLTLKSSSCLKSRRLETNCVTAHAHARTTTETRMRR